MASSFVLLSRLVGDASPWLRQEAASEQANPAYVGATPREMEVLGQKNVDLEIYDFLRVRAEREAEKIRKKLKLDRIEIESWPAEDERGRLVWVYARYRESWNSPWKWLDQNILPEVPENEASYILPKKYRNWVDEDIGEIYADFLERDSLYDKPIFSNCVWSNQKGNTIRAAWLSPNQIQRMPRGLVCYSLPQPARFNNVATSIIIRAEKNAVSFPKNIKWKNPESVQKLRLKAEVAKANSLPQLKFADQFEVAYRRDVEIFSGSRMASYPVSGREFQFQRKNIATANHQLIDMVEYLEERYGQLDVATIREEFTWRGIPQANLIAIIPGSLPDAQNKPVLLADHIDTAYSEDIFDERGERISVPGADDNVTATAALLRAAETLKDTKPLHDIWLVHFTGEEFPADSLGARKFVQKLLKDKTDISGLVLMDMIGYRKPGDPIFQINAGESAESVRIAEIAMANAKKLTADTEFKPVLRERFHSKSYLFNTDGLIFSNAGYPVVFFNEHLNFKDNFLRPHYHESTDTIDKLDWSYAAAISKVAISTAYALAIRPAASNCESLLLQ